MLPLEWCSAIALLLGRNSCFDRRGRFCSVLQAIIGITGAIAEQLDSMLSSKSQQKHKEKIYGSWQNDFYPYTIVPAVLYSDSWEIVFYRNSGVNYNFTVFWKDNRVQDLRLGGS